MIDDKTMHQGPHPEKHAVLQKKFKVTQLLSPPPSYTASVQESLPIDITTAFSHLDLQESEKPSADRCLAHLKLLEAFYQLREDISQHDGLFGIIDKVAGAGSTQEHAKLLAKIREKRWGVYVAKAAKRFETWWEVCVEPDARRTSQERLAKVTSNCSQGQGLQFDENNLPPLDVIMVWHAYQLNPRNFFEDCVHYGKLLLWRTGLPWSAINSCIDNDSFAFNVSSKARTRFESRTSYSWDSLEDPLDIAVECPHCAFYEIVPWTKWSSMNAFDTDNSKCLGGEDSATGYADHNFWVLCASCKTTSNHEVLRAQKFRRDMMALCKDNLPMQGTILDYNGMTGITSTFSKKPSFFPNRLVKGITGSTKLYTELLDVTEARPDKLPTMSHVRTAIENALKDKDYVQRTNNKNNSHPIERIAIRRMMSSYWGNASPFALDLVGAVVRQGSFIEKMHKIDWVHSPAAAFTMRRLLTKYDRFLILVRTANAGKMIAVPTLDVDLAWHTHQLSPPAYYRHTTARLGRFLNHDDKIDDTVLSEAFAWTSKTYQKLFNELYSQCACWYCEAIRESSLPSPLSTALKRSFSSKPDLLSRQLSQLHSSTDPSAQSAHISAHSAIKPAKTSRLIRENNLKFKLERDYKKSVARACKEGRQPPAREQYYYAYGVPLYIPGYVPYEGDPCVTGGMYAADPGCASFVAGAAGSCAAGSCGGGVAAGACGGDGGIAADSTGGCSGGDGGGDGGGGGGCGGCGCGGCG